jgi:hypothetical protein
VAASVLGVVAQRNLRQQWHLQGGALVSADEEAISLPAPVIVDTATLKGDGPLMR